jgi:outer membrane immunogenic protein
MRLALALFSVLLAVGHASAAEPGPPVLRGSAWDEAIPNYRDWSGFYVGGHIGYSSSRSDFGESGSQQVADILRLTVLEAEFNVSQWVSPGGHGNGTPIGVFFGYNWQSDDTIFGFDINYSHMAMSGSGVDSLARNVTTAGGVNYDVFVDAAMAAKVTDILTLRGRGGVSFGSFLPYGTLGIAVARVNILRSATVRTIEYDGATPPNVVADITESADDSKKGAFAFGLSVGLGFDWEIIPQMFVRAEYEYAAFAPIEDIKLSVHTARAGVGLKF